MRLSIDIKIHADEKKITVMFFGFFWEIIIVGKIQIEHVSVLVMGDQKFYTSS